MALSPRGTFILTLLERAVLLQSSGMTHAISGIRGMREACCSLWGSKRRGRANLWTFGALRPVIGAAFGALLGFIAGFSERFAQDALTGAEAAMTPASGGRNRSSQARPSARVEKPA